MNKSNLPSGPMAWLQGLSLLLTLLGVVVIFGWLLHIPELTRLVPTLRGMVFNTALCFILLGQALRLLVAAGPSRPRLAGFSASAVLLFALLNLLQLWGGLSLGIDLTGLHRWADDGNPNPGRMSLPTTLCFLLAASSLLLLLRSQQPTGRGMLFGRLLVAAVFALGSLSLLGYVLGLEALFGLYPLAGMALHTAIGMALLASGLWLAWGLRSGQHKSSEPTVGRLLRLATWAPALVALLAGVTGIFIFKSRADSNLLEGLSATQNAYISQIDTILSLRGTRAAIVASRPGLEGDAKGIQQALDGFLPYGFSHIELQLADGKRAFSAGIASDTQLELPLQLNGSRGEASLVWTGSEIVLRQRKQFADQAGLQRRLTSEQPLPRLRQLLTTPDTAQTAQLQICGPVGTEIFCLPNAVQGMPYSLPLKATRSLADPLQLAATGKRGAGTFRTADGHLYTTVYAPIGTTGLVSSFRVNTDALNAGVRQELGLGLLLILLVTLSGTVLLRRNIQRQASNLLDLKRKHTEVMDSVQEGLMLLDHEGSIVTANPAAARILGLSRDEITGRTSSDPRWVVIREDGTPWAAEDYPPNIVLHGGKGETGVVMGVQKPDGEVVWISVNTSPAGHGGVVISMEDITAQRIAAVREHEREERFGLLVDCVHDYAIIMLDPEGKVTSWNSGAERLEGYTEAEIIGQHFSVFYPPEDVRDGKPGADLQTVVDDGSYEGEDWRLRKDGSRYWAQVTITAIHDERSQRMGYALVSHDLTEQRQASQALAEANRLREAILDASPFSIIATDTEGTIRSINPAAERMLWYSREELVGKATPALIHDGEEVRLRALELSVEVGKTITPGFEVFVHHSRNGVVEEREWTYIRKDGSRFPVSLTVTALHDAENQISGFLGIAYDVTERKRREEYTRHIAHHDHLTGLPNRALLTDRLRIALLHSQRSHKPVALLMLDLDHFKRINDTLGHHIGDQLLVTVAQRILSCVRGADTVARMGGDEFVVVLSEVADIKSVERVAHNILTAISQPVTISNHPLQVTPSIGISLYPRDAIDADSLLRNADTAMYSAKAAGRHEIRSFNIEMENSAKSRLRLETALHRALRDSEFQLHYQPQVCLSSGRVVGMEALLRWPDPAGGMIPPDQFIPAAEDCGLIVPLGDWVLRTACREARALQIQSGEPLLIAINISPRQFKRVSFVTELKAILAETGLPPETLELEITEGLLMDEADQSIQCLREIRALGVGVAIDDFGVGYSSLAYITRFPITTLKIDRCFMKELPHSSSDAAVAQTIIMLASSLNIRVVAEGVENTDQVAFLSQHNCQDAQGFYFGAATPLDRFSMQGFHFSAAVPFNQFMPTVMALKPAANAA